LSHLSLEEQVLKEFKKKLLEKLKMTPEAFFRLCDADYEKAITTDKFMSMLKQLNLVTGKSSLERLCTIFDEDLNDEITLAEYYSALESYQVRGEETGPFDDDPSYISF
jgi:Ca2+-binding EF-hand superfamily protein